MSSLTDTRDGGGAGAGAAAVGPLNLPSPKSEADESYDGYAAEDSTSFSFGGSPLNSPAYHADPLATPRQQSRDEEMTRRKSHPHPHQPAPVQAGLATQPPMHEALASPKETTAAQQPTPSVIPQAVIPAAKFSGGLGNGLNGGGLANGATSPVASRGSISLSPAAVTALSTAAASSGAKAVVVSQSATVLKTGILTKFGSSLLSKWRSRFFVLTTETFEYFDSEAEWKKGKGKAARLGHMKVNCALRCFADKASDLEWSFVSSEKTVVVRSTLAEKKAWYDAIDELVTRLIDQAVAEGQSVPERLTTRGRPPSPSLSRSAYSYSSYADGGGEFDDEGDEVSDLFTTTREGAPEPSRARGETMPTTPSRDPNGFSQRGHRSRSSLGGLSAAPLFPSAPGTPAPTTPPAPSAAAIVHTAKRQMKSRKAAELFGWSPSEVVIKDFTCALSKVIMLHGRMYITANFAGFYSPLFSETKLVVPIADVISVCEVRQALFIPNAIKVFVRPPTTQTDLISPTAADSNKVAKVLGLNQPSPSPPAVAPPESSYFFGSFAPGGRSNAFTLFTSLLNGTFNPETYNMHLTEADFAAAAAPQTTTAEAAAATLDEYAEDATTFEDDEDESKSVDPSTAKDSLEFGAHRPSHDVSADEAQVEFKDMVDATFPTIDAKAFWKIFMSDAALYTAETFHTAKNHTEYAASSWKDASLVEGAAAQGWQSVRDTMVRVPVVGSPMGPDSTRVLKVQKMKTAVDAEGRTTVSMESVAVTPDVPFGDCFRLLDRWSVTDVATGGCRVKIVLGVHIHKPTWKLRAIKSMLVSRAVGDNQTNYKEFIAAQKAWMACHTAEVAAVSKIVARKSMHGPRASMGGGAGGSLPSAKELAALPTTASAPSPFGPLAPYVQKLPPAMQTVPIVGGLAAGIVLLLALLVYTLFGSSADAVAPITEAVAAAVDAAPIPAAAPTVAATGGSWLTTLLISLLVVALGGAVYKMQQMEAELLKLKKAEKAEKKK